MNIVKWNGQGDLFNKFERYQIKTGDDIGVGYQVEKDNQGNFIFIAPVNEEIA